MSGTLHQRHRRARVLRKRILTLVEEFETVTGRKAYWQDDNEGGTIDIADLLTWTLDQAFFNCPCGGVTFADY
jgi:hypothetical protein